MDIEGARNISDHCEYHSLLQDGHAWTYLTAGQAPQAAPLQLPVFSSSVLIPVTPQELNNYSWVE